MDPVPHKNEPRPQNLSPFAPQHTAPDIRVCLGLSRPLSRVGATWPVIIVHCIEQPGARGRSPSVG